MRNDTSQPSNLSASEITEAAKRLRDACDRWIERCEHNAEHGSGHNTGHNAEHEAGCAHRTTTEESRQHHLKMIERHIRQVLDQAYPDGLPAGKSASWCLDHGDELVAALERFKAGTYGLCADCGREISLLALWAEPHRLRCQVCQLGHPPHPERPRHFVI